MGLLFDILVSFLHPVQCALISSSQLQQCVNDGTSLEPTGCKMKFVVALTVQNNQNNTDAIDIFTSATDSSGLQYTLKAPITVEIAKSQPLVRYPIYYAQDFNARPIEGVIYTSLLGCDDSSTDATPTCGWQLDNNGLPIPFSQGFCCNCDLVSLLHISNEDIRGKPDCSFFGTSGSAHCLGWGPDWYSAFTVGPAQTWYSIVVTIRVPGQDPQYLVLGPSQMSAKTSNLTVQIIGDFSGFSQPYNLESKYFLIPTLPSNGARVAAGNSEWLLLDQYLFSTTGTECNKIGVSYEAFFSQPLQCTMPVGTCLSNQIDDYRKADLNLTAQHKVANYLVKYSQMSNLFGCTMPQSFASPSSHSSHALFKPVQKLSSSKLAQAGKKANKPLQSSCSSQSPYLAFFVNMQQATLVTLTFAADHIAYSVNVATGEILSAAVANFEAASKNGLLTVMVKNTGLIQSDFYVDVLNCTSGVQPVAEQQFTIGASTVHTFNFQVSVNTMTEQLNYCVVTLKNSLFDVVDHVRVNFTTTATQVNKGAQGGTNPLGSNNGATQGNSGGSSSSQDCSSCPFWNPFCYLQSKCLWQLVTQVISFLAFPILILILVKVGIPCIWKLLHKRWVHTSSKASTHSPPPPPLPVAMPVFVSLGSPSPSASESSSPRQETAGPTQKKKSAKAKASGGVGVDSRRNPRNQGSVQDDFTDLTSAVGGADPEDFEENSKSPPSGKCPMPGGGGVGPRAAPYRVSRRRPSAQPLWGKPSPLASDVEMGEQHSGGGGGEAIQNATGEDGKALGAPGNRKVLPENSSGV